MADIQLTHREIHDTAPGGSHQRECDAIYRVDIVMIDARRRFPSDLPVNDVCIIGGGPAGISMALRLEQAGMSVTLIESGGRRETELSRDLNRGSADPAGCHEPLQENRRRQWGGASAAWGGRCIPLDGVDFVDRSWVPFSGWPFDRSELDRYYVDAMDLCEAGAMEFDAHRALPSSPDLLPGLEGDGIVTYPIERWSTPTHFGKRYGEQLASSPSVVVVLNATCTHVQLAPSGDSVRHLVIEGAEGGRIEARAREYILATGGLENARILLASNDVAHTGIGNHSGCLGRYYQTHLFGSHAKLVVNDGSPSAHVAFDRDADGVYCRRRIWISPELQESEEILNTVFFPIRPPSGASGHRSALFSSVYLLKTLGAAARKPAHAKRLWLSERGAIASHAKVFLRHLPEALPELFRALSGRYVGSRRLPAILPADGLDLYYLQFQAEQVPNVGAHLSLGDERDAFGMRRIVVAPRAVAEDISSVVRAHRLLDERLRKTGLGYLDYDEHELRAAVIESCEHVNSAAHHLGTTRMSQKAGDGVLDQHCRVHGIENLSVVGGSAFPTSGHANPTLTIVALALRLADHLVAMSPHSGD